MFGGVSRHGWGSILNTPDILLGFLSPSAASWGSILNTPDILPGDLHIVTGQAGDLFSIPLIYFMPIVHNDTDSWGSILNTPDILPVDGMVERIVLGIYSQYP